MEEEVRSLSRLVFGGMAAQVIGTATRLGLPDTLAGGERTAAEVAEAHDLPEQTTLRLLRATAGLGLATEVEPGRFALASKGALLTEGGPLNAFAQMFTDPVMLAAWSRLEFSLRTGDTAFDEVFGKPFFEHLATVPALSALFNASMSEATRGVAAVLPSVYDFARFTTVTDVGGGDGTLLAAILAAHPSLSGVVFDSVEGAAAADATFTEAGIADRASTSTGDFFASVPAGADLFLLKSIIHDWDDDRAATILRHCRDALPADGRVLIVEPILPPTVPEEGPAGVYLSDLNMLVNVGGRERTRTDFEQLCEAAGLRVTDVIALPPEVGFSLIEAARA